MARILLIDDDEELRAVLARILLSGGHAVTQAGTGLEALSIMRREPPELVLTDLVMPDQDGIGVILTMRTELPGIPIIAMSGGATNSPMYLEVAKKLGAQRVLAKPFGAEKLFQAIRDVGL